MTKDATEQSKRPGMAIVSHEIGVLTGEVAGLVRPGPGDGEDPRAGGDADDESSENSLAAVWSPGGHHDQSTHPDKKEQFGDDGAEKEATGSGQTGPAPSLADQRIADKDEEGKSQRRQMDVERHGFIPPGIAQENDGSQKSGRCLMAIQTG